MKNTKKLVSLFLALLMVMSLAVSASAAKIEITNEELREGHTYNVYQIFTGTLVDKTLVDVKYGQNYTPNDTAVGDLVPVEDLKDLEKADDAEAFSKKLMKEGGLLEDINNPAAVLEADNFWKAETLADGYYLVVDVTEELPDFHSYSAYMVKVVGTVAMDPKADITDDDKKIKEDDYEDNLDGDDSVTVDGKASNGAVGSVVWFELTVDVPENADKYTYYYCILSDNLSEGLTFNPESVTVTVGGVENDEYKLYTEAGDFYIPENSKNEDHYKNADFQVAMTNAKALAGEQIVLSYSATINKDAIIGVEGNPNDFNTIYSNDPNYEYDEGTSPDGKPDEDDDAPVGETPVKRTITYLTGLKLKKVDENGKALTGAKFKIEGESVKHILVEKEVFEEDANGEYWLLKDGTYTTEAPRTEITYVEKTEGRDGGYVKTEEGYREATSEELANDSIILYTKLDVNTDSYADTGKKYTKTKTVEEIETKEDKAVEATVGENGVIYFDGLGEGEYTITETVTPTGYNSIDPITVTIDWNLPEGWKSLEEANDQCEWNVSASNTNGELTINDDGVFEFEIVNVSGVELPETGGIGTTMFYVAGALLAVVAIVLLVTKKRMSSAE